MLRKNSLLSFRVAPFGRNIIKCFSLRQRLHCLLVGLKLWPRDKIFQDILWKIWVFFNPHTWLLRVVPSLSWWLKSWYSLLLKVRAVTVNPVYVSELPSSSLTTVAWYTTPCVRHSPPTGWARLYSYSQEVGHPSVFGNLATMFGYDSPHIWHTPMVFLLIILERGCDGGKQSLINFRNFAPHNGWNISGEGGIKPRLVSGSACFVVFGFWGVILQGVLITSFIQGLLVVWYCFLENNPIGGYFTEPSVDGCRDILNYWWRVVAFLVYVDWVVARLDKQLFCDGH